MSERDDNPYGRGRYDGSGRYDGEPYGASSADGDERTFAVLAHLSGLIALVLSAGWLAFVGPLLIWLIFRNRGPLVRQASAGAFNFAVAITILSVIAWLLAFTIILIPVSIIIWIVVFIAQVWCNVRGAINASRGKGYRYPFAVPILQ